MRQKDETMKIVILDYCQGGVYVYTAGPIVSGIFPENEDPTPFIEAFLESKGHDLGNSNWMLTDKPVLID